MASSEFINLLSSDDEAAPAAVRDSTKTAVVLSSLAPSREQAPYLSDDFDSTIRLEDSEFGQPSKRRKLSASPPSPDTRHGSQTKEVTKSTIVATTIAKARFPQRQDEWITLEDDDPIVFTSSAHLSNCASRSKARALDEAFDDQTDDSGGSLPEDIMGTAPTFGQSKSKVSLSHRSKAASRKMDKARRRPGSTPHDWIIDSSSSETGAETTDRTRTSKVPARVRQLAEPLDGIETSSKLSEKTRALIASLGQTEQPHDHNKTTQASSKTTDRLGRGSTAGASYLTANASQDEISEMNAASKSKKPRLTQEEKARKAAGKERDKEAKARQRDRDKERKVQEKEEDAEKKRIEKEKRAREKRVAAEIAEVNKAKLDKKDSTPEMIADLPISISGQSVDTQAREFLRNLEVEATSYQSPIPHVVKWRRKVKAKWNVEGEQWEPLPQLQIHDEKHIACIMPAKYFVSLATAQLEDENVETHVAKLKSAHPECTPIYLIEGLTSLLRKNKTAKNQQYTAKVLGQAQGEGLDSSTQQANKRKKALPEVVDEDVIEDALLRLQVMNGCLVHHTSATVDTAEWIATFTQHISTIPYRLQRMNLETSFCMESGQVKTGEDKADTFVKMLQEVVRVTPSIAYGIAAEYPSVVALVKAFRSKGALCLEDCEKLANRNGALTNQRVGKAISRRLYKILMEEDPASTDV